jgi:long-chain acyl-CoA synthetase
MIAENFIKIYEKSFRKHWKRPAVSDYSTGKMQTYGDLSERIAMTHLFFEQLGIKPGCKVAISGKDSADWVVTYMAIVTYGAVVVPILPDFNPVDITHIVNHSDAELWFVSDQIWEHIDAEHLVGVKAVMSLCRQSECLFERKGHNVGLKIAMLPKLFKKKYPNGFGPDDVKYIHRDNSEIAEINYTSGTTGFSKGVMLTANSLAGNVMFGINERIYTPESAVLCFLPLAHAFGCAFYLLTPLAEGSHVVILGKTPSPKVLLKAFAEVKPHLILCVPLVLEKIYKNYIRPRLEEGRVKRLLALPLVRNLVYSKIRKTMIELFGGRFIEVIVGGAPLNHEVEEFLKKIKFPFTIGYGMTECGPLISYTYWKDFVPGSSGRTLPTMESKIMSADPEHIPGEICVRGENVMVGYYKNAEASSQVLDAEGWLWTGDMGTRSADGTLFLRGRSKTMILSASGQNIYPEEIEAKLNNMAYVAESLVVERKGRLVALVYPDYAALDADGIKTQDMDKAMQGVCADLNKIVAPYERISSIQLIPNEFEKTPKKSIKRFLYTQ